MGSAEIIPLPELADEPESPRDPSHIDPWRFYHPDELRSLLPGEVLEHLPVLPGGLIWGEAIIARVRELSGMVQFGLGIPVHPRFAGDHEKSRIVDEERFYTRSEIAELIGVEDPDGFLREHGLKAVLRTPDLFWGGDIIKEVSNGRRKREKKTEESEQIPKAPAGAPRNCGQDWQSRPRPKRGEGLSAFDALVGCEEE